MKYNGQYKQDKYLNEHIFHNKQNGTFVEVGVCDAIKMSNTYFFEKNLGWNGLCIEPNPFQFKKLIQSDRNVIFENYAIASNEGEMKFMAIDGYGKALSGLIDFYDKRHKNRIECELKGKDSKKEIVTVKTIQLHKLLTKHNMKNVDYCSIDVEGAEMQVLESIKFDSVNIYCFSIENNYNNHNIQKFMLSNGYELKQKISCDEIYCLL